MIVGFVLLIAIGCVGSPDAARAQESTPPRLEPSRLGWSQLSYRASKLAVSVTSAVQLESRPAAAAAAALIERSEGEALDPEGAEVLYLTIATKLLGRESQLSMWFDPLDGAAFQRVALESGKKAKRNRHRTNRFTSNGVYRLGRRPEEKEVGLPHEQWTRTSESFERYSNSLAPGARVTEPAALLYILSASDLSSKGDSVCVYVFSKGHVMLVEMVVHGNSQIKVDYIEESAAGERRVSGQVETLEISLDGQALDRQTEEGDFEFLGLRGDVRLYLDKTLRVPLQLSGTIKYAGKGNFRLRRVVLE